MYSPDKKRIWKKRTSAAAEVPESERRRIIAEIRERLSVSAAAAELLFDRGMRSAEEAEAFINTAPDPGADPFLLTDMDKACDRIEQAIYGGGDTVAVFGDYDVDGVTSATLLYLYLRSRGVPTGYYIPRRADGYGMSKRAIDILASHGVTLIVTVDTGVTALAETEYAASIGIDVVVTDHHECLDSLPSARAVVNPHRPGDAYPFKELAGVGVACKLVCALEIRRARKCGEDPEEACRAVLRDWGDLVAVGTVADVMPLTGENRSIVGYGLQRLTDCPRLGFEKLTEASGRTPKGKVNASFVSFTLAPRLNAAGRMDNASLAVELLLSEDPDEAAERARDLCETNLQRQKEENRIASEAIEMIEADPSYAGDSVLLLGSDDWNHGVIGIVASRITEKYDKPAILVSFAGDNDTPHPSDIGKGSGRSTPGINLFEALSSCGDCLEKFGGHEQAAGLSVRRDMLPVLRERLNAYVLSAVPDAARVAVLEYDDVLEASDIVTGFTDELSRLLEPCGSGNPAPVFMMSGATVRSVRPISSGRHTKLSVESDGRVFDALMYGTSLSEMPYAEGDSVDLLFTLENSEYRGRVSVQMIVSDIRCNSGVFRERIEQTERLSSLKAGKKIPDARRDIPGREDFVLLYGIIDRLVKNGRTSFRDSEMMRRIAAEGASDSIGFVKYKLMLGVFAESGVFEIGETPVVSPADSSEWNMPDDVITVRVPENRRKADLSSSQLMIRLLSLI